MDYPNYIERIRAVLVNIVHTTSYQTLVHSLHGLLNCEIGRLDCHSIPTEYRTRDHCKYM